MLLVLSSILRCCTTSIRFLLHTLTLYPGSDSLMCRLCLQHPSRTNRTNSFRSSIMLLVLLSHLDLSRKRAEVHWLDLFEYSYVVDSVPNKPGRASVFLSPAILFRRSIMLLARLQRPRDSCSVRNNRIYPCTRTNLRVSQEVRTSIKER